MKPQVFFARHPVFRHEEFFTAVDSDRARSTNTKNALLTHYKKKGKLVQLRRGLYAVVPAGSDPQTFEVDPFILCSRITEDAVVAYHTALQFHERAYSIHRRYLYFSHRKARDYSYRSLHFQSVRYPKRLLKKGKESYGVSDVERQGMTIRVTTIERTLVDLLDRPELGGGWEEIWRSLETVEFFDLDQVIVYAQLLGNATTTAKVGYFLEQHRDELMVEDRYFEILGRGLPKKPHYMVRTGRISGRFFERWNLIVPDKIADRSWQEVP
jgi:predicted transcriptional regulator of viral defense system